MSYQQTKTSDDYKPCVCMYPNGTIRKTNVLYVRLDSRERALEKLHSDRAAWVSYPDYDAIQMEYPKWPKLSV